MNIWLHELKTRRLSLVIWSIVMLVFMLLCMAKYQTVTASGGEMIKTMFATFPKTIQAVFGMNGLDLTAVSGYFGVCFLFVVVILAIHAGLTGAGVLAEDERDHLTEFLYVKPRSRAAIITAKLLAGVTGLIIVWLATVIGSLIAITKFASMTDFSHDFWVLMAASVIIQLVFFSFGAATAVFRRREGSYGKAVAIAVFVSYFLYVVAKLSDRLSWIHYGSIFSYFDALDILTTHSLKSHYVIGCLVLSGLLITLTYIGYGRRDLRL